MTTPTTINDLPPQVQKLIAQDVDGYYYYWPDGEGSYASHHLREIADVLDVMNALWDYEVQEMLGRVNAPKT